MKSIHKQATACLVFLLAAGLSGCGNKTAKQVAAMNKSNIQRLANMYSAFQNYKGGAGPKTEAEFKQFIAAFDPDKLDMMGIKAGGVDALFMSERDGQHFKIRYSVGGGRGSVDAVVFEQQGKDGTKQVAYTGGKVEDVDAATSEQLWAAKAAETKPKADPKNSGRPSGPPPGAPTGPR
jgi:hypothetical protein